MKISGREGYHKTEQTNGDRAARESGGAPREAESTEIHSKAGRESTWQKAGEGTVREAVLKQGNPEAAEQLQQAAGRVGQELIRMEIQTLKTMEDMAEQAVRTGKNPAGEVRAQKQDLAEISQESKNAGELRNRERRAELAAWNNILKWMPDGEKEITVQIRELREIYTTLLQEIMQNVPVQDQPRYIEKLEQILIYKLDLLMKEGLPNLSSFFVDYGTRNSLCRLREALYFQVTGLHLALETIEKGWNEASREGRQYLRTDPGSAGRTSAERGAVLQREQESGVYSRQRVSAGTAEHQKNEIRILLDAVRQMSKSGSRMMAAESPVRIKELQKAEFFIRTIVNDSRDLFSRTEFNARNERLYGVLWTLEKGKSELFLKRDMTKGWMRQELETSLEQMTAARMQRAIKRVWDGQQASCRQEEIYDVYRYAMKQYAGRGKINKAIRDGFYYALRYFLQKSSGTERETAENRRGFFQEHPGKLFPEQELEQGSRILEEDWREYLAKMGYEEELLELVASLYGPWAALIRPEASSEDHPARRGEALAVAGGLAALAVIAILAIVFF